MSKEFEDIKAEITRHFKDYSHIFLATDESSQPRVRPVTLVNFNHKFWILTGTNSAKVKQIRKNPKIEFCLLIKEGENNGYVRAAGIVKIINDKETKAKVAKHCEFFSEHWKSFEDLNYTLLELELDEIEYLKPREDTARKFKLR